MAPVDMVVEPEVVLSAVGLSVSESTAARLAADVPFRSEFTPLGLLSVSSI